MREITEIKTLNGYPLADTKARADIATLSEEIEQIKDPTSNKPFTETGDLVTFNGVEGSPLEIKGAYDNTAANAITAKLVHCGQNIVDQSLALDGYGTSVYKDGWIVFSRTQEEAEASGALEYFHAEIYEYTTLRPGRKYRVFVEFANDMSVSGIWSLSFAQNNVSEVFESRPVGLSNADGLFPLGVYTAVLKTKDVYDSNVYLGIRSIGYMAAGVYGTIKYRFWIEPTDDDAIVLEKFTKDNSATYVPYTGTAYTETLVAGHTGYYAWPTLAAKAGVNNIVVSHGTITVSGETPGSGVIVAGESKFDASKYNIPIVYLTGDTSAMTKDNAVTLNYKYGDLSGTCTCKWQGSSSLSWPKKNYTIKFDNAFEAKEGWGAQTKYCFKANFIDHSHCRNVVSCKLWGEIVKSRTGAPAELKSLPNGGAIDGFPCVIVLNDEFHGLYTWNIPKDGWMFGAPKAILCADAHTDATKFKALATLNGDFELEYVEDENDSDWVLTSINTAIQAVLDSDGSNLDTTVNQYVDIASAIDYYIHTVDEAAADATDKNYILVTFDKVKWYFSAYDRDTVYGLDWDGKKFYAPNVGTTYQDYANIHRLMGLIYEHKAADLKSRAVALHKGAKSEANVANVFTNFASGIPSQILDEDARKWPTIPATTTSNIWQILNWYRLRRAYLDPIIDSWS